MSQVTRIVSSENLWLHFNFLFVQENQLSPYLISQVKGQTQLFIVTYLSEDEESAERGRQILERHVQRKMPVNKYYYQKRLLATHAQQPVSEDLQILALWHVPSMQDKIGPGLMCSITSEKRALGNIREEQRGSGGAGAVRQVKYICESDEDPFYSEKNSVYMWLFEHYKNNNTQLRIGNPLTVELENALNMERAESYCEVV